MCDVSQTAVRMRSTTPPSLAPGFVTALMLLYSCIEAGVDHYTGQKLYRAQKDASKYQRKVTLKYDSVKQISMPVKRYLQLIHI
jgi:hypothetical protein